MSQVPEFYRKDIDGLRAIAILAVVAYHVGLPGVPGGFVGVDVFFVVSGYLITSILLAEAQRDGSVSLYSFYARRIRRLLPALFVVVSVTTVLGFFLLLPIADQQQSLARSAIATALYISNFYFWIFSPGYFDQSSDLQPLLHTWSLAVEEQFYFIWPPMVWGLLHLSKKDVFRFEPALKALTVFILVVSLAWSVYATEPYPEATFFLLPARAWELATGASLALWLPALRHVRPITGTVLSIVGLLGIALSVARIGQYMAFPGYLAVLPVAGTALVVAGGRLAPNGLVSRALSTRPMVLLGLLSYSWYLWHWPLLALTRAYTMQEVSLRSGVLIGILSLGLAYASYRTVENPIRFKRPGPFKRTETTLAAGIVISLAMCAPAAALGGWAIYFGSQKPEYASLIAAAEDRPPLRSKCHQSPPFRGLNPAQDCTIGDPTQPTSLVLWGDSHADHLSPMIQQYAETNPGVSVLVRSFAACPPDRLRSAKGGKSDCARFNDAVLAELSQMRSVNTPGIILAGRWLAQFGAPEIQSVIQTGVADYDEARYEEAIRSLTRLIRTLAAAGHGLAIVGPVPEMQYSTPACLARKRADECSVRTENIEIQRAPTLKALETIRKSQPTVRILDFIQALCDAEECPSRSSGIVAFLDDDHLTARQARRLAKFAEPILHDISGT